CCFTNSFNGSFMTMSYLSVTELFFSWHGDIVCAPYCAKCPAFRRSPPGGYLQRDTGSIWSCTLAAIAQWLVSHPPPGSQTGDLPPNRSLLRRRHRVRRYQKRRFSFSANG